MSTPRFPGSFPAVRMRSNRYDAWTRRLVAENTLTVDDLIWPIFVQEGTNGESAVASMPRVKRVTVDRLPAHVEEAVKLGVPAVAIFPMTPPEQKDAAVRAVAAAAAAGALPVGAEHGLPLTRFPLAETAAAHDAVEDGIVGKVLIDVA